MKYAFTALLLFLAANIVSQADQPKPFSWRDSNGKPAADTPNMKSKDGFGGQLILTANEQVYDLWAKPQPPRIDTASTLPVGKLLVPVVIFVNPRKDKDGLVDVSYDLEVIRPDGSVARKIPDIICAKGPFTAPQFNLQLSQSEVKWGADAQDPLGTWTFKLLLKDNISGTTLPLESSIEIVTPKQDTSEQAKTEQGA